MNAFPFFYYHTGLNHLNKRLHYYSACCIIPTWWHRQELHMINAQKKLMPYINALNNNQLKTCSNPW